MNSYSLSNTCGRRLALINGGKFDGKYIYLYDSKYKCCVKCNDECDNMCCNDCCLVNYHLKQKNKVIDYCKLEDMGEFLQAPTNILKQRDALGAFGKAGCGKSVYISQYIKLYGELYPNNKRFLFSMKKKDENLDPYIDKRVNLEKYVEKGGLTIDDFSENCLICFDDIDELDNSKEGGYLKTRVQKLMNQVLQVSRSKNITVVSTNHVCLGGADTKVLLNAMNSFTFFIASVSSQIKNCLKTYVGLNKDQIQKILNLQDTRWVTIFLTSPMVVLTQKEIFILK